MQQLAQRDQVQRKGKGGGRGGVTVSLVVQV